MYELAISAEPLIQKCKDLAIAKNPYLEVVNGRIQLSGIDCDVIELMNM